jgi:hypothetical protein
MPPKPLSLSLKQPISTAKQQLEPSPLQLSDLRQLQQQMLHSLQQLQHDVDQLHKRLPPEDRKYSRVLDQKTQQVQNDVQDQQNRVEEHLQEQQKQLQKDVILLNQPPRNVQEQRVQDKQMHELNQLLLQQQMFAQAPPPTSTLQQGKTFGGNQGAHLSDIEDFDTDDEALIDNHRTHKRMYQKPTTTPGKEKQHGLFSFPSRSSSPLMYFTQSFEINL